MRKAEQNLWDTMHARLGRRVWLQRVENAVGVGMPDVYAQGTWIELKAPARPSRASTPLLGSRAGLRPSQINWHRKAHHTGVPSFILIRDDHRALYLIPGGYAGRVNAWTVEECDKVSVANHWEGIEEIICAASR